MRRVDSDAQALGTCHGMSLAGCTGRTIINGSNHGMSLAGSTGKTILNGSNIGQNTVHSPETPLRQVDPALPASGTCHGMSLAGCTGKTILNDSNHGMSLQIRDVPNQSGMFPIDPEYGQAIWNMSPQRQFLAGHFWGMPIYPYLCQAKLPSHANIRQPLQPPLHPEIPRPSCSC